MNYVCILGLCVLMSQAAGMVKQKSLPQDRSARISYFHYLPKDIQPIIRSMLITNSRLNSVIPPRSQTLLECKRGESRWSIRSLSLAPDGKEAVVLVQGGLSHFFNLENQTSDTFELKA